MTGGSGRRTLHTRSPTRPERWASTSTILAPWPGWRSTCPSFGSRLPGSGPCTGSSGSASWWPGRPCRRVPAQIVGDHRASRTGGRPAVFARVRTVDRCRRGVVRPDLAGGQRRQLARWLDAYEAALRGLPEPEATRRRGTTERRRRGSDQAERPPGCCDTARSSRPILPELAITAGPESVRFGWDRVACESGDGCTLSRRATDKAVGLTGSARRLTQQRAAFPGGSAPGPDAEPDRASPRRRREPSAGQATPEASIPVVRVRPMASRTRPSSIREP